MNDRLYFSTAEAVIIEPIQELSRVFLKRDVKDSAGEILAKGAKGTVVSVYGSGESYLVEFTIPYETLVSVDCADIEPIEGEGREDFIAKTN